MNKNNYLLSDYEIMLNFLSVVWRIRINKIYPNDKYKNAIQKIAIEYPYLRSKYNSDHKSLTILSEYLPKINFYEKELNDEEYILKIKEISKRMFDYTNEYIVCINKEKNESVITGIFNHGCCDALSIWRICDKFCLYLSNELIQIKPKLYIPCTHKQVINIHPNPKPFENLSNEDMFELPKFLHEEKDPDKIISKYCIKLIRTEEFNNIYQYCHNNSITIQSLLWISCLISNIKMVNKEIFNKLPLNVRFLATALITNRLEFNPSFENDDVVCGVGRVYIEERIKREELIINVLKDINNKLKEEVDKKQQFYDFMSLKNYNNMPKAVLSSTTLGVLPNESNYNNEFEIKDAIFFAPINVYKNPLFFCHLYSYKNIGCYFCCSYTYPHFYDDEIEVYVNDIIKIMKYICNEENKDKKIKELINSIII